MVKIWPFPRSWLTVDRPSVSVQHHFCQCYSRGFTPPPTLPHPMHYCQHLSVSNCSIKPQACQPKTTPCDVDDSSGGKGPRYEWLAGRNVQFPAVWDFHLSSAQWRRAREQVREREKKSRKRDEWTSFPCSTSWTEYQLELCMKARARREGCEQARVDLSECRGCFHILPAFVSLLSTTP